MAMTSETFTLTRDDRAWTVESEHLLDQAAGFARAGDFLGAQARARFAVDRLNVAVASLPEDDAFAIETRTHLDLMVRHYDSLVREWQTQVDARHTAYVARERLAIGVAGASPGKVDTEI
jgi:hypothetical protein